MTELKRFELADTQGAKKFFDDNGFVIFSNGLNYTRLQDFNLELAEIVRAHLAKAGISKNYNGDEIFDLAMSDLEAKDHKFVASIYDTIFQCPSFLRIVSEETITDSIRLLMDKQNAPLYGYTNRCRIDLQRTRGEHMVGIKKCFILFQKVDFFRLGPLD